MAGSSGYVDSGFFLVELSIRVSLQVCETSSRPEKNLAVKDRKYAPRPPVVRAQPPPPQLQQLQQPHYFHTLPQYSSAVHEAYRMMGNAPLPANMDPSAAGQMLLNLPASFAHAHHVQVR